tara:strand:- start:75 stop:248 length:174 start_codon:yes stop_codon:yes gene_type:complete
MKGKILYIAINPHNPDDVCARSQLRYEGEGEYFEPYSMDLEETFVKYKKYVLIGLEE